MPGEPLRSDTLLCARCHDLGSDNYVLDIYDSGGSLLWRRCDACGDYGDILRLVSQPYTKPPIPVLA